MVAKNPKPIRTRQAKLKIERKETLRAQAKFKNKKLLGFLKKLKERWVKATLNSST